MFNGNLYIKAISSEVEPAVEEWTRHSDWLAMPSVQSTDQTFIGLHAVFPSGNNFVAFNFTTSTGNYQVDWGDGTITTHASNTVAEYTYDYSTYDISNSTLSNRGYKQVIIVVTPLTGDLLTVNFNLRRTTTPAQSQNYSTGFLDCILSMPNASSGASIVFSASSQVVRHSYIERFQILNSGVCTNMSYMFNNCNLLKSITLSNISNVTNMSYMFNNCVSIQAVPLFNTSNVTNMQNMFAGCSSLRSVPLFNTGSVTDMSSMFNTCASLRSVPSFNTENVTTMANMFFDCASLISVPLFNTSNVTTMASMFTSCSSLRSVPSFNTENVTTMANMFFGCVSLRSVPLFNTGSVTLMQNMFNGCRSLLTLSLFNTLNVTNMSFMFNNCASIQSVPLFNTSNVTNMQNMFAGCSSLRSVPLFNTGSVTNMTNMFTGCKSLQSVPLFNTGSVTNMTGIFSGCASIQSVPLFNTSNVTNMSFMFSDCTSIQSVPLFNTSNVTNMSNMFFGCNSLDRIEISLKASVLVSNCQLSKLALEEIFNNLSRVTIAQTIGISGNWGTSPLVAARTYTTTTGSNIITTSNTASLEPGMEVAGTNSPLTTPVAVTFQDAGDTVTLTSHGLEDSDEVSFATITGTTGILTNTIYYIVNKTIDTFQISTSVGGSPISLTVDGSGTMRYRSEIVSIVPNTSITMSRPMRFTGTPSLTFRQLKQSTALHKGWTVSG